MAEVGNEKVEVGLQSQESSPSRSEPAAEEQTSHAAELTTPPSTTNSNLDSFLSFTRRDGQDRPSEPPPLPFNLRDHKVALSIFTILCLLECCVVPLALYFGLRYGTNMRSGMHRTYHQECDLGTDSL